VGKNKKGEPLITVACAGCGRTQRLRERRVVLCEGYTCGFGGHCAKNPRFVLPAVPDGCVRHIVPNAAGAFSGYNTRFANPEEIEAIARARDVLIIIEARRNLNADREGIHGQLASANRCSGKPDASMCGLQAVRRALSIEPAPARRRRASENIMKKRTGTETN